MKTYVLLRWYIDAFSLEREMFQTNVVEEIRTHILLAKSFFLPTESLSVYEITRKNMVQPKRPQMAV